MMELDHLTTFARPVGSALTGVTDYGRCAVLWRVGFNTPTSAFFGA